MIKYNLEANGYQVLQAQSGEEALNILENNKVDIVLLDFMLPNINGLEVLKKIRMDKNLKKLPVIMLTEKSEEFDKVLGFEMGADDYIPKPFGTREVIARLKALLRRIDERYKEKVSQKVISIDGLEIGLETRTVTINSKPVEMSFKEFELLKFLAENPGKVYSRDILLEKIWGYEYIGETRTVDVHIRHIRKKIEPDNSNPVFIKTVRGFGYKFRGD